MLEWSNVHRHVASEITLLCDQHHSEKTKGLLPKEMVIEANNNPYNSHSGVSQNYLLHYTGASVTFTLGKGIFKYENLGEGRFFAPIVIDGLPMVAFSVTQGKLFLDFKAFDQYNVPIIQIKENELIYDTKVWDIEWVGQILTIREAKKEILIQIIFQPPTGIAISKGRILRNGIELLIDDDYVFVMNNRSFFGSINTTNHAVGFAIGQPIPKHGAGIVFSKVSRYGFNRTESLMVLQKRLSERSQTKV
jgi:trigger factor